MATLTPVRVPFGTVSDNRLQALGSKKNTQNALFSARFPTGVKGQAQVLSKRKASEGLFADDPDTENIAPTTGPGTPSKKAKFNDFNSASPTKPPTHFVLKSDNTSTVASSLTARPLATPRSFMNRGLSALNTKTPRTAPAGRSPTRKRTDKSKRRSAPFARFDPPAFAGSSMPFSIDAALSGSVSSPSSLAPASTRPYNDAAKAILSSSKESWFFDIHEDTPDQELGNLMEFSTQTLDISDDEEKLARKQEQSERGKENIPPELNAVDMVTLPTSATARISRMDDEPRTPLGELEARQFYADGCDEQTSFLVPGDDDDITVVDCSDKKQLQLSSTVDQHKDVNVQQPLHLNLLESSLKTNNTDDQQPQDLAVIEASSTTQQRSTILDSDDVYPVEATSREEAPLFEIWESESAKEDNEEPLASI